MTGDAALALNWVFSALVTCVQVIMSSWLLSLFVSLGILLLIFKIYNLLT